MKRKSSYAPKTFFLSGRWRPNEWAFWALMGVEFVLTVALLALVGIAAPNLYRTRLRAEGAHKGWNSSPAAKLYAAANYRPYKDPVVWSQFLTNYNLVIVVLSMFLMLVKSIMYMLHVFPPIISVVVHSILAVLFIVSTYYQASPDMSDPEALQRGAPWYIRESCSVVEHQSNKGYCQQAKATFACTLTILGVFLFYLGLSIFSCFPSPQHRAEYNEKKRLQREKYGFLDEPDHDDDEEYSDNAGKNPNSIYAAQPSTPGLNPMTPRTFAFNKLSGTKNMPLRATAAKNNAALVAASTNGSSTTTTTKNRESRHSLFGLRSPGVPRTPRNQTRFAQVMTNDDNDDDAAADRVHASGAFPGHTNEPMYFPPPPTNTSKK